MTEPTRIQAKGLDRNALKATAFELSPDPALVVNAEGSLVAVNEAAESQIGRASCRERV